MCKLFNLISYFLHVSVSFGEMTKPHYSTPVQVEGKAVFITGCDSGFGHALAKHLHKLGFMIFAGCLLKVWIEPNAALTAVKSYQQGYSCLFLRTMPCAAV